LFDRRLPTPLDELYAKLQDAWDARESQGRPVVQALPHRMHQQQQPSFLPIQQTVHNCALD
jgi:hypothetical protein